MFLLIRVGAYLLSGAMLWHMLAGGPSLLDGFSLGRRLALDPDHGMIFGVCAGVANYCGVDVSLIRMVWTLGSLYRGIGVGLYILAFLIMPLPVQ
ncbi:MAG: PspC domain-containing protein [Negativicutes bacterium]|nr:PspC domain-containing protein [Negativicutes bacterium]